MIAEVTSVCPGILTVMTEQVPEVMNTLPTPLALSKAKGRRQS